MYGVGILGLGYWYGAYRISRSLHEHPKAKLLGVYDERKEKAMALASTFGVTAVKSPKELLDLKGLDIVFIAAPSVKIPEYGILTALAGKNMIVGKPIATDLEQADKFIEAVEKKDIKIVTMESYDSAILQMQKAGIFSLIEAGELGRIVRLQSISHSSIAEGWYCSGEPGWFADPSLSPGGAFIDYAIYDLELLRYVAKSEVDQIHFARIGNLVHRDIPVEDWGLAAFTFANGIEGTMEASWTIVNPRRTAPSPKVNSYSRFEIIGTEGRVVMDLLPYVHAKVLSKSHPYWDEIRIVDNETEAAPPVFGPLEHLIAIIEGREHPLTGLRDARQCLAAFMLIYNCAKRG